MCTLCEIVLNNNMEMKRHMRTHSFTYVTFKCALCDFIGGEQIEMEIHDARLHSEKNECALCDFEGKDLETIDNHLSTCESYYVDFVKISSHNLLKSRNTLKIHIKNQNNIHFMVLNILSSPERAVKFMIKNSTQYAHYSLKIKTSV